ncbi:amine oxidase [Dictyocaulus viviparus]|uniref:Amine oxidase n=1 Tax=Dictyocaulus viviparus TaxID=29172 RepID=A0A0D8Y5U4_DICVI|nr:amine oxidase [Dictyocaulus viviparus]
MRSTTLLIVVIGCGISVQRESNEGEPFIAIVGAGISGLSAARRLIELDGGYLQMGAQFINGAKNPIYKIASALGVISGIVSDKAHLENADYLFGDQKISRMDIELFTNFTKPLDSKYRRMAQQHNHLLRNYTIESKFMEDYLEFLKENNITGLRRAVFDALMRSYRSYWEFEWGGDWTDLSPLVLSEFNDKGVEGESFLTNKHGYKAILDNIKEFIPKHMIHFNTTILNINYTGDQVILTTSHGYVQKTYDYVIMTSSLGHLKKYHQNLFTPPLPRQKIEAIEKIGFGGTGKIFFRWKEPWWSNNTYSITPLPVKGMARDTIDNFENAITTLQVLEWNPNTLMAWVAGSGQEVIDNMSDDELKNRITLLIRDMKNDHSIPEPSDVIRTRLTKDELLLGSYSYISLAQAKARIPHSRLAIPVKHNKRLKILFAGEATHHRQKVYVFREYNDLKKLKLFQTVIGAYLSGRREADRLNLNWKSCKRTLKMRNFCETMKNNSEPE